MIGFDISDEDIAEAADTIRSDPQIMSEAASDIMQRTPIWPRHALLLHHSALHDQYRGRRMTGAIVDELRSLLRLSRDETLVLFERERERPDGGPYENGPERDAAMSRSQAAYRPSGFEPWETSIGVVATHRGIGVTRPLQAGSSVLRHLRGRAGRLERGVRRYELMASGVSHSCMHRRDPTMSRGAWRAWRAGRWAQNEPNGLRNWRCLSSHGR